MEQEVKYEDSDDFIILSKEDSDMAINGNNSYVLAPKLSIDDNCEEAMVTIKEVLKENNTMKDVLLKNNQEIKRQCDEIRKWKEEVERNYTIHKEAIEKYKIFIKLLEKEKQEAEEKCKTLKNEVDDFIITTKEIIKERKNLMTQLEQSEKLHAQEEAKLKKANDELQQLKATVELKKQESIELKELNEKLQLQYQQAQDHIKELTLKVEELESKGQQSELDLKHKSEFCSELEKRISELTTNLRDIQLCLQHQEEENKSLEAVKATLIQDLEDLTERKDEQSYVVIPPGTTSGFMANESVKPKNPQSSCNHKNTSVEEGTQTEVPSTCEVCSEKEAKIVQLEAQLSEANTAINNLEQNLIEEEKKANSNCEVSLPPIEMTKVSIPPVESLQCMSNTLITSVIKHQTGENKKIKCRIENLLSIFKERLESTMKQDKIFIEQLQKDIDSLRNENHKLQTDKTQTRQSLQYLKEKCAVLERRNLLDSVKIKELSSQSEVKQLKYTIDCLTAELLGLEFSKEDHDRQKKELSDKIQMLNQQLEEASAHKFQADCYAADYIAEHDLRIQAENNLKKLEEEFQEFRTRTQYGRFFPQNSFSSA